MGRAARRQQERSERRSSRSKQGGAAPRAQISTSGPQGGGGSGGGSFFKPRWAMDILSELRKVTWPSRQETTHLTVVVIVVSAFFGAILGAADLGFGWLVEQTILR